MNDQQPPDGYLLVHGGYHGAWCWERVIPLLDRPALAVDLPGRGARPSRPEAVTVAGCAAAVIEDADAAGFDRFVLVAHSLGGVVATAVATLVPQRVAALVYIGALVTAPGSGVIDSLTEESREAAHQRLGGLDSAETQLSEEDHRYLLSPLASPDVESILPRLVPEPVRLFLDPVDGRPRDVPTMYVRMKQDRAVPPELADRMIAHLGPGVAVREIDSGHEVMYARPAELAVLLREVARTGVAQ